MNRQHRKENIIEEEKDLIKKYNRLNEVRDMISNLGYKELDKPIRWGYDKFFILRADVAKRKDAKFIQSLLDMVNTPTFSRKKDFICKDWRTKKYIVMKHELDLLSHHNYNKLSEKEQSHFVKHRKPDWRGIWYTAGFELSLPPYYFVEKIKSHWVYKVKITDSELESEEGEIEHYFESHNSWIKLNKIFGWSYSDDWGIDRIQLKEQIMDNDYKMTLEELHELKIL